MTEAIVEGEQSPSTAVRIADLGTWRDFALCKTMGTALFYPNLGRGSVKESRRAIEKAIEVCKQCPVRISCYDYAKRNDEQHGVWGGYDFYINRHRSSAGRRVLPDSPPE